MAQIKLSRPMNITLHPIEAAKLFEKATTILGMRDWTRGSMFEVNGSVCGLGALACAVTDEPSLSAVRWDTMIRLDHDVQRVFRALDTLFEQAMGMSIPMFNDHVAESITDVRDAFLKIAASLRATGDVQSVGVQPIPLKFTASSISVTFSKQADAYVQDVLNKAAEKKAAAQADHELAAGPGS